MTVSSRLTPSELKLRSTTNRRLRCPVILVWNKNVTSRLHCSTDQTILEEDEPHHEITINPVRDSSDEPENSIQRGKDITMGVKKLVIKRRGCCAHEGEEGEDVNDGQQKLTTTE